MLFWFFFFGLFLYESNIYSVLCINSRADFVKFGMVYCASYDDLNKSYYVWGHIVPAVMQSCSVRLNSTYKRSVLARAERWVLNHIRLEAHYYDLVWHAAPYREALRRACNQNLPHVSWSLCELALCSRATYISIDHFHDVIYFNTEYARGTTETV
jgi:hypothetical protein